MGAPQFTPGPWRVEDRLDRPVSGGGGALQVQAAHRGEGSSYCVASVNLWESPEANARLIAAVPELYEALSEVVTLLEGWHRLNFADEIQQQSVRLAKRALAKARGEQEPYK
jgi:hypothetical protein